MSEMEDSWMNPQTSFGTSALQHEDGVFWQVSRKRRTVVSGPTGYIETWEMWAEFRDKAERDAELKRLRETTSWTLRGDKAIYIGGQRQPNHWRENIDV